MIDIYLQGIVAALPSDLHAIGTALRYALPVILIGLVVWLIARALQRWIDRMEAEHPAQMRTADAQQIERDVQELWKRCPDTIPLEHVQAERQRPRVRAGLSVVPPADRPAA